MEIKYIWHDCFTVRTPECSVVFDYWKDPVVGEGKPSRFIESGDPSEMLPRDLPLYVVVSHHHKDHFNREIFRWAALFPNIRYILSRDTMRMCRHVFSPDSVYAGPKVDSSRATVLRPGESFSDGVMKVAAFGSTDIGNSYIVETGGYRLFHAGDLNAWVWADESTSAEVRAAIRDFEAKLEPICRYLVEAHDGGCVDVAMFPVDSRIGSGYYTGAKIFVRAVDTARFLPMHFGLGDVAEQARYERDALRFSLYANPDRGDYLEPGIIRMGPKKT